MIDPRRDWYRMHDTDNRGAIRIDAVDRADLLNQATAFNRQGYGIFWTVNAFNGPRQIANLERINSWAVDMDAGTKDEQRETLRKAPLVPSFVVETKRGYQAYWNAKDGTPEHWNAIVLERLVPFFGADKNARDLARILRVPGFLHLKDPTKPFMVRTVHVQDVAYTELQMVNAFPVEITQERHEESKRDVQQRHRWKDSDDFWQRVYDLDCETGLERIGSHVGERYTFKRNRNGNKNILVDGKGTSCWIDKHGRIGSLSHGGPTLYQWLLWFKKSPRECVEILKREFPHLESKRAA